MNRRDAADACADGVQRLVTLAPDAGRAERTRARCQADLRRRRRRAAAATEAADCAWRVVGFALVGGACVLYAAALVATTVRLALM
jgi:hypothetical protein